MPDKINEDFGIIGVRFTKEHRIAIEQRVLRNGYGVISYYIRDLVLKDLQSHGLLVDIVEGFSRHKKLSSSATFRKHSQISEAKVKE